MNKFANTTILIVDDEELIRESLRDILEDEGFHTLIASNAQEACQIYHKQAIDIILLDIWMPDMDGITLLQSLKEEGTLHCPVIIMSGHGNIETAVEATKLGAYDFLEKPLSSAKLLLTIERALQTQALISQNHHLKAQIDPPVQLIGKSPVMEALRLQAEQFASQQFPILITGSSGAGKRHLAHFIHQHSAMREGKFITANLSVMNDEGQIKAFLLGNQQHKGLITQAENGTLYLDEISQLNEENQTLILKLIEQQQYISDGGLRQSHVRLILGSRLSSELLHERLLPQLYDQLTIATLKLPHLRDHNSDVPELLDYFSRYFADFEQLNYRHFSLAAQNVLRQHSWNGNVRELKNLVQRLLIQSEAAEISAEEAKEALTPNNMRDDERLWSQIIPKELSLREAREVFEYQYLREQFRHCDGNIAKLSQRVGMDRTNLYRKLRSLGIDPTEKPHNE